MYKARNFQMSVKKRRNAFNPQNPCFDLGYNEDICAYANKGIQQ